jgi:hypothetical protein
VLGEPVEADVTSLSIMPQNDSAIVNTAIVPA